MKLRYLFIIAIVIILLIVKPATMKITSPSFQNGESLPRQFTCNGAGINPELNFSDIPATAKSLALIYEDPDAPKSDHAPDGLWIHWLVWNIQPSKTSVNEGETGFGVVGMNSSKNNRFDAPCPPNGEHRYIFKLYALDTDLNIPTGSTRAELITAMQGHILTVSELLGRYSK